MVDLLNELLSEMNKSIEYVHFKSNQHLYEGLIGKTDLDFLVKLSQKVMFRSLLIDKKFVLLKSCREQTYSNVEHWIGFDEKTGALIHIHVYYELVTGKEYIKEYKLGWEEIAFQTSIWREQGNNQVRIVCPEFEIILLLTRIACKASIIQKIFYYLSFSKFVNRDFKIEYDYLRKKIEKKAFCTIFTYCFYKESDKCAEVLYMNIINKKDCLAYKMIYKLYKNHIKNYYYKEIYYSIVSYFYKGVRYIKKILRIILNCKEINLGKTFYNCGKVIAIIGCDGSGKSTITKEIVKWLSWKIEVKHIYLGSGNGYFSIYKMIKNEILKRVKENTEIKNTLLEIKQKNILMKKLEELQNYRFSSRLKRLIRKNQKYIKNGAIVITDRYPQNQFIGIFDGPKIEKESSYLAKLEKKNFMTIENYFPDIVIKLKLPLEMILLRRPDDNIDILKKKTKIVEQLNYNNSLQLEVDASMPFEEEILFIKRIIWDELYNRDDLIKIINMEN